MEFSRELPQIWPPKVYGLGSATLPWVSIVPSVCVLHDNQKDSVSRVTGIPWVGWRLHKDGQLYIDYSIFMVPR